MTDYELKEAVDFIENKLCENDFFEGFINRVERLVAPSANIDYLFFNSVIVAMSLDSDLNVKFSFDGSDDGTILGYDLNDIKNELLERFKKKYPDWYALEKL